MKTNPLVRFTKCFIDFMFVSGIIVCLSVPVIFRQIGKYFSIFKNLYTPYCILFMIAGIFAILILWNLRNIFKTVIKEDPFVRENVKSLKMMGIYAFFIAFLMVLKLIFVITFAGLILILVFLIAGLFSLVLSQVFNQAVTYKQENDLTI